MGQYDAGSLRSTVHFISSGQTMAFLQRRGNVSCWNDALHTSDDWSQDVTGALDKPSGYRVQFTLLGW